MPQVGGALSAHVRQYQGTAGSMSNAAKLGRSFELRLFFRAVVR